MYLIEKGTYNRASPIQEIHNLNTITNNQISQNNRRYK